MPNPIPASDGSLHSTSSSVSFRSGSPPTPERNARPGPEVPVRNGVVDSPKRSNAPLKPIKTDVPTNTPASPTSPSFTSLPQFPSSPESTPKHAREPSRSIFANLKAAKSSSKIHTIEPTIRKVRQDSSDADMFPDMKDRLKQGLNSKKSLARLDQEASQSESQLAPVRRISVTDNVSPRAIGTSSSADNENAISDTPIEPTTSKGKTKFGGFLKRSPSLRSEDVGRKNKSPPPIQVNLPDFESRSRDGLSPDGPLTAPIPDEHHRMIGYADQRIAAPRNRSVDRHPSPQSDRGESRTRTKPRSRDGPGNLNTGSQTFGREPPHSSNFLSGLKNTTSRAAEGLGKAGQRLVLRAGWKANGQPQPASTWEEDRNYQPKIIYLPLIEQTRLTRIAKRLEDSKDKTEFWMPAVPWRCIDYLNYKGCEVEGLYRVPGGSREIKFWEKRFDQEHDINLFDEPELYDINIIGSLFKRWLTNLPDYIFPKETQDMLASKCSDQLDSCPQLLKDELSKLPPWNYYLLFAITCHLSLLHAHVDKNKMSFENLRICFAPALKMNGECFRWLVCDWRSCWQGCWTEKEYLEEEYRVLDREADRALERERVDTGDSKISAGGSTAVDPNDSRRPSLDSEYTRTVGAAGLKPPPTITTSKSLSAAPVTTATTNTAPTIAGSKSLSAASAGANGMANGSGLHARSASHLPELSLPQPISPIFLSQNQEQ
ncbi:hypothetical protein MMC25_005264 [Agyrium rufum]|nr:hypothetical protein [Agyrium rufum]